MITFTPYASSSAGNLYQVSDSTSSLLVECGLPIREIKRYLKFDLSRIEGCLLTHAHGDHAKAAREIMAAGIDLYCSQGTAEALDLSGHRLHIVQSQKAFKIGPWQVLPFDTQHDVPEPLGFLIVNGDFKLLFATDTYYVKWQFRGLTHIAIECNYSMEALSPDLNFTRKKRLMESHMGLHTLKDFFRANDLSAVQE
ncbi:MAG: MBL fold metallo-hydrolase, partial [Desulfobacterium sp.]|nr:MBL fold metallo-hydrolase [Desulfobacterium sp.]